MGSGRFWGLEKYVITTLPSKNEVPYPHQKIYTELSQIALDEMPPS